MDFRPLRGALQDGHQLLFNLLSLGARGVSLNWVAVAIDEEHREVPFDGLGPEDAWFLSLDVVPQRVGTVSIDIDFSHHGKVRLKASAHEIGDLLLSAGFLATKLVARETQNGEPLILVLVVELRGGGIPTLGVPTLAGGVHDDHGLSAVLR